MPFLPETSSFNIFSVFMIVFFNVKEGCSTLGAVARHTGVHLNSDSIAEQPSVNSNYNNSNCPMYSVSDTSFFWMVELKLM
ncbi:hypothetical protein D3C86_1470880 [compost metagenome]